MKSDKGYSLLELLVATTITALLVAAIVSIARRVQITFAVEPEASDMQQRLRGAADALTRDLLNAGAGVGASPQMGPLRGYVPGVVPYRLGALGADPPGTFRDDAITLLYIPADAVQTTITSDIAMASSQFTVAERPGCPLDQPACGFNEGDTALVYDTTGNFETFVVTSITSDGGTMVANRPDGAPSVAHPAGSRIAKAVVRTYFLKRSPEGTPYQLASYAGGSSSELPVADHIVGLRFDYFGDPLPSSAPPPPPAGVQTTAYPPGENCAFAIDPENGLLVPRATVFSDAAQPGSLVRLTPAQLTDGPWCPDGASANRFDVDLLRIRMVAVTLRVESATDSMRGARGLLFARPGTATDMNTALPDRELMFQISIRN